MRDPLVRKTSEFLSVELSMETSYDDWLTKEPGTARDTRTVHAFALDAGLRPERIIDRGVQPRTLATSVLSLDVLPATGPRGALGPRGRAGRAEGAEAHG